MAEPIPLPLRRRTLLEHGAVRRGIRKKQDSKPWSSTPRGGLSGAGSTRTSDSMARITNNVGAEQGGQVHETASEVLATQQYQDDDLASAVASPSHTWLTDEVPWRCMKVQQDPKFARRLDSASANEQDTANSTRTGLLNSDEAARVPTRAYLGDAELATQEYSNVSPRNLESKRRSLADDARDRLANAKNVPFSVVSSDVPSTLSYAAEMPRVSSMPPPPVPKRARTSLPRSAGGGQGGQLRQTACELLATQEYQDDVLACAVASAPSQTWLSDDAVGDDLETLPYSDEFSLFPVASAEPCQEVLCTQQYEEVPMAILTDVQPVNGCVGHLAVVPAATFQSKADLTSNSACCSLTGCAFQHQNDRDDELAHAVSVAEPTMCRIHEQLDDDLETLAYADDFSSFAAAASEKGRSSQDVPSTEVVTVSGAGTPAMTKFAGRLAGVSGARLGSVEASGACANEQETSNSVCCSQERVVKEFETLTYAAELPSTQAYAPALVREFQGQHGIQLPAHESWEETVFATQLYGDDDLCLTSTSGTLSRIAFGGTDRETSQARDQEARCTSWCLCSPNFQK